MGLKDLVIDAVEHTTDLVQETHRSVVDKTLAYVKWIEPLEKPVEAVGAAQRLTADAVYMSIRLINRAVGVAIDAGHELLTGAEEPHAATEDPAVPMRSDVVGGLEWSRDSALGVVNGVVGDYLARRGNALALEMSFRHEGRRLTLDRDSLRQELPDASSKLCVFVHGLACTEWSWSAYAEQSYGDPAANYGRLLQRDLGYTPVYLRYNSGLHVSQNGKQLSALLDELLSSYPVAIDELVLVGHSMGGLVVHSGCHYGTEEGREWVDKLRHVFCLGTPHLGAPLEKASALLTSVLQLFDTPGTQIPAKIIDVRSAGIKDLRHGYLLDDDWLGKDPDAWPSEPGRQGSFVAHAAYYFVAACISEDPDHPMGKLVGDLMVRLPSAARPGWHESHEIHVAGDRSMVVGSTSHLRLANHPEVYEQIRRWCAGEGQPDLDVAAHASRSQQCD